MIAWYWMVIVGLYAAGAAVVFTIHCVFDGWSYGGGGKKSGMIAGLTLAVTWPLWALVCMVIVPLDAAEAKIRAWRGRRP